MNVSNKLAQKISSELNFDEEKSKVVYYGIFAFLQVLASLALVTLFGLLFGVVTQALVASFASSILRQYSGGVHATRPSICLIVGTLATIAIAVTAHYSIDAIAHEYLAAIPVILILVSYYLVIKLAPVDSPAKPIRTQTKRNKMKKLSLIVLSVYAAIIAALLIFYFTEEKIVCLEYAMCIGIAVGWQSFNLTIIGHRVLKKVDSVISKILMLKRRD